MPHSICRACFNLFLEAVYIFFFPSLLIPFLLEPRLLAHHRIYLLLELAPTQLLSKFAYTQQQLRERLSPEVETWMASCSGTGLYIAVLSRPLCSL